MGSWHCGLYLVPDAFLFYFFPFPLLPSCHKVNSFPLSCSFAMMFLFLCNTRHNGASWPWMEVSKTISQSQLFSFMVKYHSILSQWGNSWVIQSIFLILALSVYLDKGGTCCFCFVQYQGLNPWEYHWDTSWSHLCIYLFIFWDRVLVSCPGWPWTCCPPAYP